MAVARTVAVRLPLLALVLSEPDNVVVRRILFTGEQQVRLLDPATDLRRVCAEPLGTLKRGDLHCRHLLSGAPPGYARSTY